MNLISVKTNLQSQPLNSNNILREICNYNLYSTIVFSFRRISILSFLFLYTLDQIEFESKPESIIRN